MIYIFNFELLLYFISNIYIYFIFKYIIQRYQYINACNTFNELLNMGVIPIVNENDTICNQHSRYGDNDTLSGITAGIVSIK